jgi:hypothetical protein
MCCPTISASFITFSLIALVSVFTLALLNMIFACVTPSKYDIFVPIRQSAYKDLLSLSMLDDLKTIKNTKEKTPEEIRVLQEKSRSLIQQYSKEKLDEVNDKIQRHKTVLMAFGIAGFSVLGGFIIFFIPIYSTSNCGANCSEECDCNCDCWLCLGVTPIKRIVLFYSVCFPTVLFSFVSFFLTLAKKSTYKEISAMQDIKQYKNKVKDSYWDGDYYEDSVFYNEAQFIDYLIMLLVLVLYPVIVWLTSSYDEMHPPIIPYKRKNRVISTNINTSSTSELKVDYNYTPPPQPKYSPPPPPPQPKYTPPPPQPHYHPPPPKPHYHPPPPPQPHYHPPPPQPHYHPPPPHYHPPPPHYHPPPPQPHYYPPGPPHQAAPALRSIVPGIGALIPNEVVFNIH